MRTEELDLLGKKVTVASKRGGPDHLCDSITIIKDGAVIYERTPIGVGRRSWEFLQIRGKKGVLICYPTEVGSLIQMLRKITRKSLGGKISKKIFLSKAHKDMTEECLDIYWQFLRVNFRMQ